VKYEDLEVWQRSVDLSVALYKFFAHTREFGFKEQITRSGLSIPSNIAEGAERFSTGEKSYFFRVAKGSCGELATQIHIGIRANLIDSHVGEIWMDEVKQIAAMLGSLINHVNKLNTSNS
jgi:four helix bundle protein